MGKKPPKKKERVILDDDAETTPFNIGKEDSDQSGPNLSFLKHMELQAPNWTDKQKKFLRVLTDAEINMILLTGPAGTSKTFLAVYAALQLLKSGHVDKIMYIRSVVESASKSMGALPGTASEKFLPYSRPLLDKMDEIIRGGGGISKKLMEKGIIEAIPVGLLRGSSMDNTAIIVDESQSMETKELITVTTRIGKGSRLFICGDVNQSDIGLKSGLGDFVYLFNDEESLKHGVQCCTFTKDDIVRSEFLKFLIGKYETLSKYNTGK